MERTEVTFGTAGERLTAWVFEPEGSGPHPAVVLAHGLGGVREARLDAFAERFANAGLLAVVFDYRHWGASEGEPRQLLDINRQLEDWRSAVAYTRSRGDVDLERLALWGTSFSGGHVIAVAADDSQVAAAISQVPNTDSLVSLAAVPVSTAARLTLLALRDEACARLGRPPVLVPLQGPPGSVAAMTSPDAEPGYRALLPADSNWRNEIAARVLLRLPFYRPVRAASRVRCPLLVCVCDYDEITPPSQAWRAARRAPRGELKRYPVGHFSIYTGENFEQAVSDQTRFLTHHL